MSRPTERRKLSLTLAGGCWMALELLLAVQVSSAAPSALHVSPTGELYEFDVATGDYELALTFEPQVDCQQLTRAGESLFCSYPTDFDGVLVSRLEPSSASVGWQVTFPNLEFPDGIDHTDSLLYVVAHVNMPRRYFLLTLDPANGEELDRVEIDLGGSASAIYSLAARGSQLWVMTNGDPTGTVARRLDPLSGTVRESFVLPGVPAQTDADFGPGGRLFISYFAWNPFNTAWCSDYWRVPFLGATPEHQFSHCWVMDFFPPPPMLDYFTLADGEPVAEIPTLGTASACLLAALLALAGLFALRRTALK